jgi:hypothetical protein
VNYVNAPSIARERGIEVRERSQSARDYTNLLRVEIRTGDREGSRCGHDDRQRQPPVARQCAGLRPEIELSPLMVLFRYDDVQA